MKLSFKNLVVILLGVLIVLGIFYKERTFDKKSVSTLVSGKPELCLNCHREIVPEKVHERKMLGCSSCHLGNPYTVDFKKAHENLVKNPGDLRIVSLTCGKPGCHPYEVKTVKTSLMATNHGILKRILEVFDEKHLLVAYPYLSVENLYDKKFYLKKENRESLALDYFRKLCGTCHLFLEKGKLPYFLAEKGGGCSACHVVKLVKSEENQKIHPTIVRYPPMENCVRCHNRSGRIGFTYQGLYENEQGGIGEVSWIDGRTLQKVSPDVHFTKGLSCVDCHTKNEIMGDGVLYQSLHQALEITCETCHLNKGKTKKGTFLTNIKNLNGKIYLQKKGEEKLFYIKPPSKTCSYKFHKRLTCSACHSHYIPDCYGCHIKYDPRETHLDKILKKETKGLWVEHESYRRFTRPTLAVENETRIVTVTPG